MRTLTLAVAALAVALAAFPVQAQRQPGSTIPNNPAPSTFRCDTELGFLRRVHEEDLSAIIDENDVSVVPVCEGESYGNFRTEGNAGALLVAIAENEAMVLALNDRNYRVEDVVGVRMTGDNSILLYVHPFHH